MTPDSASYAVDAVHRLGQRLDAIQDRLGGTRSPNEGQAGLEIAKLESNVNAQMTQSKTLIDAKQIEMAIRSLQQARVGSQNALLLPPTATEQGRIDVTTDGPALVELIAAARLTYASYGLVLDTLLRQAESINDQAWYWTEVEENPMQTATYLVQTLPTRVVNLVTVLAKRLGDTTLTSMQTSSQPGTDRDDRIRLNADTFRRAWRMMRDSPVIAIGALFPLSVKQKAIEKSGVSVQSNDNAKRAQLVSAARILTPLGLTRHEARAKRTKLMTERDAMATRLGTLAQAVARVEGRGTDVSAEDLQQELWSRVWEMQEVLGQSDDEGQVSRTLPNDLNGSLQSLVTKQLAQRQSNVDRLLSAAPVGLGLPSRLARLWPMLVFGPVAAAVSIRIITRSWDTILVKVQDAKETVRGFAINWVYEPCVKLLDTIRTGDQDGVIMTPESLNSDLQSLERMVSEFSAEKYGLSGAELDQVAARVREGDLTTVLRIYETELKSPLKSAITGSLIRSLLIQIQKVKVDIAVAMRGVDQLLKSQQLLFGAIGIAPAMGIIYFVGGFMRTRFSIALGSQGRRAGQSTRYRAWEAMRRIDRLLADPELATGPLPPLTQGLLLLDLALLRKLAPQLVAQAAGGAENGKRGTRAKRLRAEFLCDVRDLETPPSSSSSSMPKSSSAAPDGRRESTVEASAMPGLGWHARRAAVDRMWKSWGTFMSLQAN